MNGNADPALFDMWVQKLGEAWTTRDPEKLRAILAVNVIYHESPFGEPLTAIDAVIKEWQVVPNGQKDISFNHELLTVAGDVGYARWQATFTRIPTQVRDTLDGIFVFKLNQDGKCTEFRQWWVVQPLTQ